MDTIGLDLHKRESQLCIDHDDGTVEELRIATTRERFIVVLGNRPRVRTPKCAGTSASHREREQKAEQQLEERRGQSKIVSRQVHIALDAGRRFTESGKEV